MQNVEITTDRNILTIKIDLSQDFGPSASGKTRIIASTKGNTKIGVEDIVLGLNCYKPNK